MALTENKAVLSWIDEMAKMTQPDKIVWIDGSREQIDALRAEACATGEMHKRYGLVYVDKDNDGKGDLHRIRKDSFYWYKELIATNGASVLRESEAGKAE